MRRRFRARTAVIFLLAGSPAGCASRPAADPVVLSLGDQVARRSEYERHLKTVESRDGVTLEPAVRDALLQPWLEERVVVLEARARGLVPAGADDEHEQAAAQRLLQQAAEDAAPVTEADVQAEFAHHPAECRRPERITLRQILVATENEARDVRRRLQKDPTSFGLLARARSRGPEAPTGGVMGTFARGELPPDLEKAAFLLVPDQPSEVVHTEFGYHVLRVDRKEEPAEADLPECSTLLRTRLARERAQARVSDFVRTLMSRAKVNHEAAKSRPVA